MTLDAPTSIVATADVRSHLGGHLGMLKTLATLGRRSLVVDAGDFFEGTGYYLLDQGSVERRILADLYDLCLPGNHGFAHYLTDPKLRSISVCANLAHNGGSLFSRARRVSVAGVDTLITGVIGAAAFEAIPAAAREGVRWFEPARCVRTLAAHFAQRAKSARRRAVVVLSHSGWRADLELAAACPEISVIFSGHGKSDGPTCARKGSTTVARGDSNAAGFVIAQPALDRWDAQTRVFRPDAPGRPRESLRPLHDHIDHLTARLAERIGPLHPRYRGQVPDGGWLLTRVALEVLRDGPADHVVVNNSVLRPTRLSSVLTRGQCLECAPFGSHLVMVELGAVEARQLPARLAPVLGPLTVHGDPPSAAATVRVVTTDYIARSQLGGAEVTADLGLLSDRVARVLTQPADLAYA